MNWLWLNIPLAALIFLAVTGIPLWLVIRHPDAAPAWREAPARDVAQQPRLAVAALAAATPDIRAQTGRQTPCESVDAAA
jgi:hypothetical protein